MKNFKSMLIIASISLLALVGCNKPEQSATETTPAGTSNSTKKVPGQKSTVSNAGLLAVVSKTKIAVTSGNFVQAKKEFDRFEDAWKEVEDGIKAKSRDNYEAVEKSMDEISGELKAAKPQKDKLLDKSEKRYERTKKQVENAKKRTELQKRRTETEKKRVEAEKKRTEVEKVRAEEQKKRAESEEKRSEIEIQKNVALQMEIESLKRQLNPG